MKKLSPKEQAEYVYKQIEEAKIELSDSDILEAPESIRKYLAELDISTGIAKGDLINHILDYYKDLVAAGVGLDTYCLKKIILREIINGQEGHAALIHNKCIEAGFFELSTDYLEGFAEMRITEDGKVIYERGQRYEKLDKDVVKYFKKQLERESV